jgi:HAD superfamily hydrolase (TIGR01509 family)
MTLKALLFDVDGTIADTEEVHRLSYNQAFLRLNLGWDWDPALYADLLSISGGTERLAVWIDRLDVADGERQRLRQLIPHIHRTKTEEYAARLDEGQLRLRPGVLRLIREACESGLQVGCVSSSAWSNVSNLLAVVFRGASGVRIAATVGSDMVPRKKPAPDLFEMLMRMMRVEAHDCLAIEDSGNGVASARAAGLAVLATPSRWTRGQDFSAATIVLSSLGEPDSGLPADEAARLGGSPCVGVAELRRLHERAYARASESARA